MKVSKILLLVPQFTKLLLVQLGKTDMGFYLLLLIFKTKTKKNPLCLYPHHKFC